MTRDLERDGALAAEAAEMLRAVAHPVRLRIVALLARREEYVNGIAESLGVPQSVVSQQLRILRMHGLVRTARREGRVYCRLGRVHLRQMLRCVGDCLTTERGAA